jgi:leucyl-tRNA synthetase
MELVNQTYKSLNEGYVRKSILKETVDTVFLLLAPFTPHASEEVNEVLGNSGSIFKRKWPRYEEAHLHDEEVEIAVLVNGKVRDKLTIDVTWPEKEIKEKALALEKVKAQLKNTSPKKVIYIEKRIVNIVL